MSVYVYESFQGVNLHSFEVECSLREIWSALAHSSDSRSGRFDSVAHGATLLHIANNELHVARRETHKTKNCELRAR